MSLGKDLGTYKGLMMMNKATALISNWFRCRHISTETVYFYYQRGSHSHSLGLATKGKKDIQVVNVMYDRGHIPHATLEAGRVKLDALFYARNPALHQGWARGGRLLVGGGCPFLLEIDAWG